MRSLPELHTHNTAVLYTSYICLIYRSFCNALDIRIKLASLYFHYLKLTGYAHGIPCSNMSSVASNNETTITNLTT